MQVLYGRHHVRVFRFGLRLVRDEQVAEDLISEVFLDVWRQAGKFEGRSAVSTWLLAITRFKALSALRRRKDAELDDEAANAIEDTSDDPEVAVQKKDTSQALRKCLSALSPEHREIVDLVYYHEKSVEEVAEIVGIPENTVKTRLFYARKKLGRTAQGSRRGARLAMMATSKKMLEQEPGEIEMLLPWHAAGTLNARDARRVEEALARDPELARQYAVIREEYAETIDLNESLGAPSARAMQKLFAAIDAEPARKPSMLAQHLRRISGFFASLSPRTLAWSASLGALALLLQAGVIGAVLVKNQHARRSRPPRSARTSRSPASLGPEAPPRALVRFAPDARVADITALLDSYQASIVDGAKGGMFRLQFGNKAMSKDEIAGLMSRLQEREDRQSRGGHALEPRRRPASFDAA